MKQFVSKFKGTMNLEELEQIKYELFSKSQTIMFTSDMNAVQNAYIEKYNKFN
ncbi:hypothetical protein WMZ97_18805 [Lentibacillus sp. N15]